jgi:hypothetical protein
VHEQFSRLVDGGEAVRGEVDDLHDGTLLYVAQADQCSIPWATM